MKVVVFNIAKIISGDIGSPIAAGDTIVMVDGRIDSIGSGAATDSAASRRVRATVCAAKSIPSWVISTPFGSPVVPDVKAIAASPGSGDAAAGRLEIATLPEASTTSAATLARVVRLAASLAVSRGLSGTSVPPARQMPNIAPRWAKVFSTRSATRPPPAPAAASTVATSSAA